MTELKKLIAHLDDATCMSLESVLTKNQGDNFLFLYQAYKNSKLTDEKIMKRLKLNMNSFYVLKSRLHDRIKHHLVGDVTVSQEEILKQVMLIPKMCYESPRILAETFFIKLEKDLMYYDMHNELLHVYGSLKKMHLYSEKHFQYSQLYNRQVALGFCLEKSEEILGEFNRLLGQYNFSRSPELLEKLLFLRKELVNNEALNPSRQIRIIKNIIELQLLIFCKTNLNQELNEIDILENTVQIIRELPLSSPYKKWDVLVDFLYFEYYIKIGQLSQAAEYFTKVDSSLPNLFLYTGLCNTSRFLISKMLYLVNTGKVAVLTTESEQSLHLNNDDIHTKTLLGIYKAMAYYFGKKYKNAIDELIETSEHIKFKDYLHINIELKLTLAFFYMQKNNFAEAKALLSRIHRAITAKKSSDYTFVFNLIKLFTAEIEENDKITLEEQKDLFTLFAARNKGEHAILQHLMPALNKKYL